jgi:hypothetical protein
MQFGGFNNDGMAALKKIGADQLDENKLAASAFGATSQARLKRQT